jgi:hypothetical protein
MAENVDFEVDLNEGKPLEKSAPEAKTKVSLDIEIEDDTPVEDRGRQPIPKELVEKLEQEAELDIYDDEVKSKLKAMKKVYHDERREKERASREREEALALAKQAIEENKRLKSQLTEGEKAFASSSKDAAERALQIAKAEYKAAYDAGDGEALAAAQVKVTQAAIALQKAEDFKPTLQTEEKEIQLPKTETTQQLEPRTAEWLSENTWFGSPKHKAMSSFAYGVHEELLDEYGSGFNGTKDYFRRIDKAMRQRFPDYFREQDGDEEVKEVKEVDVEDQKPQQVRTKPAPVVAPASRSTAPKKVRLKQSQIEVAKRLGISPEAYAKEFLKLEN